MKDWYPTRNKPFVSLERRSDPVVWSVETPPGPLSASDVERFRRDGYLLFPRLFSENEIRGFFAEVRRLKDDPSLRGRPEFILEPSDRELRSIFNIHRLGPAFQRLAADERLVSVIRQLIGSDVYVHQSRVNLKPGFVGKEFYWHSDFETWHAEDGMPRPRAVSCAISLTPNNEFNGALMVIPGSHTVFVSCAGQTPVDHYKTSLQRQQHGVPDRASLETLVERFGIRSTAGPAGTLLVFDSNLMHGSNGNISPYPRSNIFLCYNSVENALVEPFSAAARRPDYVASRDVTPIPLPSKVRS